MDQVDREPDGQANPAQIRRSLARAERGAALDVTEATALLAARGRAARPSLRSPRPGSATPAFAPPAAPASSPTPPRSSSR